MEEDQLTDYNAELSLINSKKPKEHIVVVVMLFILFFVILVVYLIYYFKISDILDFFKK